MKSRAMLAVLAATGALSLSGAALAQTSGGSSGTQSPMEQSTQGTTQTMTQSQAGASGGMMDPSSMSQEEITKIQQALKDAGHDLTVDGVWGEETETALREFQEQQGMEASGELDQETMAALNVDMGATAEGSGTMMGTTGTTGSTGTTGTTGATGTTGSTGTTGATGGGSGATMPPSGGTGGTTGTDTGTPSQQ